MNRLRFLFVIPVICVLCGIAQPLLAKGDTFIVVIDAGHGGKDPGAKGVKTNEKTINLAVALKLGNLISAGHNDVQVIYTRKTDKFVELSERANIANRHKADLFISIHTNSLKKKNTSVKGAETYTLGLAKTQENLEVAMLENSVILLEDNYMQRYEGFDPNSSESYIIFEFMQNKHMEQSVSFASEIQKEFVSARRVNRGVRQAGFLVLKATSMPSVLVELGFISNREEERYMHSTEGQNRLAKAIYNAFSRYKRNYVRKQGGITHNQMTRKGEDTLKPREKEQQHAKETVTETPRPDANEKRSGTIVYKVQILTSDRRLPAHSPKLKGYKASFYQEGKAYKYTYGESSDFKEIQKIQKKISKDFRDAFIIRMKDGKRLK
ncbi:N-acetylmuramoyl-L-alanine amidase [Tannerella sp.]|uniref:N-acetylmuramoyl-L-alanine amidase family protein n=1 Tax=Tannerella sp. TaxID=2382127 RepID=UPI0026DCF94A|nr:N-acetylmuramoyl-L-alanine amidase [Tannerella sp.]MDO4702614.1 N-acetylmuramoyl-L-alanine amidase [Tannerella sp.]